MGPNAISFRRDCLGQEILQRPHFVRTGLRGSEENPAAMGMNLGRLNAARHPVVKYDNMGYI